MGRGGLRWGQGQGRELEQLSGGWGRGAVGPPPRPAPPRGYCPRHTCAAPDHPGVTELYAIALLTLLQYDQPT